MKKKSEAGCREVKVTGMMNLIRVFKVGNDHRPAGPGDIKDFEKQIKACYEDGTNLVCRHSVQMELIGSEEANLALQLYDRGILTKAEVRAKLKIT